MVTVRRVVTGHDADGKSIIASDGPAPQFHERPIFAEIWNTAGAPTRITAVEESRTQSAQSAARTASAGNHHPRGRDAAPVSARRCTAPERWTTASSSQGEVYLVLEDSETLLQPGDIVIQRGTNHAWDNRSESPARMAFILIDAEFDPELTGRVKNPELVP